MIFKCTFNSKDFIKLPIKDHREILHSSGRGAKIDWLSLFGGATELSRGGGGAPSAK